MLNLREITENFDYEKFSAESQQYPRQIIQSLKSITDTAILLKGHF